jgi:hypothetical protein
VPPPRRKGVRQPSTRTTTYDARNPPRDKHIKVLILYIEEATYESIEAQIAQSPERKIQVRRTTAGSAAPASRSVALHDEIHPTY